MTSIVIESDRNGKKYQSGFRQTSTRSDLTLPRLLYFPCYGMESVHRSRSHTGCSESGTSTSVHNVAVGQMPCRVGASDTNVATQIFRSDNMMNWFRT